MSEATAVKVWIPDIQGEDDARELLAPRTCEEAAEDYAGDRYLKDDYPDEQIVHVRDTDGNVHVFRVYAEPAVTFCAVALKS